MARTSAHAYGSSGLAGAIAITLGLYVAVGLCLGGALFWLMKPKVIDNPGVAAYRPPPWTVLGSAPSRHSPAPPVEEAPVAPRETDAVAANADERQRTPPKRDAGRDQASASKRARRPPQRRDPMRDFAYQPSFGFRPWF